MRKPIVIPTAEEIAAIVEHQLQRITDPLVLDALQSLLIKPVLQERKWFYSDKTDFCWAVAEHPETDTCYVYGGFVWDDEEELLPWGLVLITELDMGMDSYWSKNLEIIFYDSFASHSLQIWDIIKRHEQGEARIIASSLTNAEAEVLVEKLNAEHGIPFHSRTVYSIEPRTKNYGN
jgi:hypothetical protein